MADNYLEKRMDDYRNGRLSATRKSSKLTHGGNQSRRVSFRLEVSRVFVALECRELRDAVSRAYAEAGCRVAFCGCDRAAGTEMAQRFGLMFCPVDVLDGDNVNRMAKLVEERWHGFDLVITDLPGVALREQSKILIVASKGSYDRLCSEYSERFSAVVYETPATSRLPEKAVKPIVENVLLQGCNADAGILTELKIRF